MKNEEILNTIQKIAEEMGFDLVGVAEIASSAPLPRNDNTSINAAMMNENSKLDEWVKNGYHAEMKWFKETVEKRRDILKVMPDAKSVVCVAMNYYCDIENKKDAKNQNSQFLAIARNCEFSEKSKIVGKIARYARGRPARTAGIVQSGGDYHKIFDKKLKLFVKMLKEEILLRQLADQNDKQNDKNWIPASAGTTKEKEGMTDIKFKYYCDTGPVLERAWAVQAGLGFIGKNTNLITKYGSWVLLGEIITNIDLGLDSRLRGNDRGGSGDDKKGGGDNIKGGCGNCHKCLDACPTGALVAPYTVDARKCISYLTIEHRGEIPMELREKMGNRIFGCDACQEVCPFNIGRQKEAQNELNQQAIAETIRDLKEILSIKTDEEFLEKFAGSPLMRAKRRGLVRNACIAAGNLGDKSLLSHLKECLNDKESIIVSHAKWAIEKIEKMIK